MTAKNTALVSALVSSVLNLPPGAVDGDSSMESIPQWDSVAQLNICLEFLERFGVDLDMDTIASATNVARLASLLPN